jgi:gas vesicle protein
MPPTSSGSENPGIKLSFCDNYLSRRYNIMSDNSSEFGAFLAGFVIGGLVGAATALILAPQSGEQTRGQISSKSTELYTTSGERVQQYRDLSTEKIHDYQVRASQLIHNDADSDSVEEQTRIILDDGSEQVEIDVEETETDSEDDVDAV